ncbi:MAG: hypothetical protein Ct9H300mP28_08860 [Pseudomonadota bacterium]|nr:MAG: hypothetical protein Ct9H300mP28_08860 [Pseudomonadota bacterium]
MKGNLLLIYYDFMNLNYLMEQLPGEFLIPNFPEISDIFLLIQARVYFLYQVETLTVNF